MSLACSMYTIIRRQDGTYLCWGRLQDGTERWEKPTLDEAVESLVLFAKGMNGQDIGVRGIQFLKEEQVTETKLVPWEPHGKPAEPARPGEGAVMPTCVVCKRTISSRRKVRYQGGSAAHPVHKRCRFTLGPG